MRSGWGRSRRRLLGAVCALAVTVAAAAVVSPGAAVAEAPAAAPAAVSKPRTLTAGEAVAQARRLNRPVVVSGATTPTELLTANVDGTLSLRTSLVPVRQQVDGQWKDLDATLHANADGSVSPAVSSSPVVLSGGGMGPLVRVTGGGLSFEVSLPVRLPKPVLSGDTATYPEVLAGVDVVVRATRDGRFSEVLVVKTADAATNPLVRSLALATKTDGVIVSTDATGNIVGKDRTGRAVLAAPAPLMWDSMTNDAPTVNRSGRLRDAATGADAVSSPRGPGRAARTAPIKVGATGEAITLTPEKNLLARTGVTYPVFIDPTFTWNAVGPTRSAWSTVAADYPTTKYWNATPDPEGYLQVGNIGEIWSRSLLNFAIPVSTLSGATINSAVIDMTLMDSYNCTAARVNMYAPATTMTSSNAYWNYWDGKVSPAPSIGSVIDYQDAPAGGCPPKGVAFTVTDEVKAAVTAGKTTQTFFMKANNESTYNGWKEFNRNVTMTVHYNHVPSTPTGMTTSPQTSCTAATPGAVGNGQVTLYAPVSDRNNNTMGVEFTLWKTADATQTAVHWSNPATLIYGSGTTAVLNVPVDKLSPLANGTPTQFSWKVRVTDYPANTADTTHFSAWSATCNFTFDPTRAGAPTVTPPAGTYTIGQPATFTIDKPDTGTVPSGYIYQLNAGPYSEVASGKDGSGNPTGNATVTISPTRFTNTLTVTSVSASGNIGAAASITFNANPAAIAPSDDLTGDGGADLLTPGGTNSLPAGLWLANGKVNNQVDTLATNIGANGNGVSGTGPADFTGAQIITGHFTGTGLQDVLAYYPSGANAGGGSVLNGNGDGSVLQAQLSGNQHTISAGLLTDVNDTNPLQLANAGDSSHQGFAYPDLIAVNGNATHGYYLNYYRNQNGVGNYAWPVSMTAVLTPTGGTDWNTWQLASTQLPSGTALYLHQRTTGKLYLWTALTFDTTLETFGYTQHLLKSSGWNTGGVTMQAADIDRDGDADLWTVGATGAATAHLVSGLPATPTLSTQTSQHLITANHAWLLNDGTTGTVESGQAKDSVGTLHATGTTGAEWNTGDLFDPSVRFNGTTGTLTTSGPAVTTNADFNLGVWVKLGSLGGVVLSQDGTNTAAFKLWAEPSDKSWRFAMSRTDAADSAWDTAVTAPETAQAGAWTYLSVHFLKSKNMVLLKVNGANAGSIDHPTAWNATGSFRVGSVKTAASTYGAYLDGQVANVQAWNVPNMPSGPTVHCTAPVAVYGVNTDGSLTYTLIEPYTGTIVRRLTSTAKLGFTPVSMATLNNDTLLVPGTDGDLRRVDILSNTKELTFTVPAPLGSGWTLYHSTFDGTYFFGITGAGALRRYEVTKAKPVQADIINWSTVGTGFGLVTFTATAPNHVIGSRSDGVVRNYRIPTATSWVSGSPGNWGTNVDSAFSPGGGLYYVRDNSNAVTLYRDAAPTVLDDNPIPHITTPVGSAADWGQSKLSAQPGVCG